VIAQPSTEIPSGTTLGKYDILRKLATGGMAEIYLARGRGQAGFEKLVVLKRILPAVAADPTFVRMFLEEAKLAATLRHPHIADVWEVDCVDGMYFYTMEYIHGQDVRAIRAASRKRNERMPLAIAVGIVSAVASALEYAHDRTGADGASRGLVHRDISASNVLVSYDGAIKLLDFGIAHAADRSENTRTGSIKGKVPYMSPEQCQGRRLDRRSDLFSLGTVLYELTVGRRPFRGDSDFIIMEQIVRSDPARPTELDAQYPAELERIVLRLLSRDLEGRYATADELISDLEQFQTTNGLWVSAKVISRFMRSLFWDNIEAWERAARDGSLEQHITTINVDAKLIPMAR
jgi:serine/threonine protein kinase